MKLSTNSFALAWALTVSIMYSIVSALMAFDMHTFFKIHAPVHHLANWGKYVGDFHVTWESYALGASQLFLIVYLTSWLFAFIYNYLNE